MCKELTDDLTFGKEAAKMLAQHLEEMGAAKATISVTRNEIEYVAVIQIKADHDKHEQEHKDLANRSWDVQDYESLQQQLASTQRMCAEYRDVLEKHADCYCSTGSDGNNPCPRCKALQSTTCGQDTKPT